MTSVQAQEKKLQTAAVEYWGGCAANPRWPALDRPRAGACNRGQRRSQLPSAPLSSRQAWVYIKQESKLKRATLLWIRTGHYNPWGIVSPPWERKWSRVTVSFTEPFHSHPCQSWYSVNKRALSLAVSTFSRHWGNSQRAWRGTSSPTKVGCATLDADLSSPRFNRRVYIS